MGADPISLSVTLAAARARLVAAGIQPDEAAVDVDVYATTILGWDRAALLQNLREPAPPALEPKFSQWIARREHREPTAYIVGSREFWGRPFVITSAVLIPRPETEFIIEEALVHLRTFAAPRIADIGTGSGILAVTLAAEVASARVTATDLSSEALEVAKQNAERHGVETRVTFLNTSYLDGVPGMLDLIVTN